MAPTTIPLGFTVGAGEPVSIPLKHLAVTGQTQEAGKTTTLEALIARADVKALTFVTKRGESAFTSARRIDPYFREQADWQFVASVLEASRSEKLKFERAWIIRASKGARTLADVHRNVRTALTAAKGLSADVYLTLDAYLEVVVPQIGRIRWAPTLQLSAGINAMDLTGLTLEMQHLVIKSALDWVLEHATHTVVVIPEAWKFLPQSRGTPVKLAAESFIRQSAALSNYLWLDSQDLGGIDKTILRNVVVWLLGVQREANELARTLSNIPSGVAKPKASDIALLGLGQFYACWGRHALKTYVQPLWFTAAVAAHIAIADTGIMPHEREDAVTVEEAEGLRASIERLTEENKNLRTELARVGALNRVPPPNGERAVSVAPTKAGQIVPTGTIYTDALPFDDAAYEALKRRLIADLPTDPRLMELLVQRPELHVVVHREMLQVSGTTTRGRVARLIAEEFFGKSRTMVDVLNELERRGRRPSNIELSNELKALTEMGFFTRENKWYTLNPTMKVNVVEA